MIISGAKSVEKVSSQWTVQIVQAAKERPRTDVGQSVRLHVHY